MNMKKISLILLLLFVSALSCSDKLSCGGKNEDWAEKEAKLTENTSLNQQIADLKESLKGAGTDSEKAEIYTKIALANAEKGNVVASMKSAEEAVKFQPNQYIARYSLGKAYIGMSRYDDAVAELNKSIELKDNFAPAYFELGNAYYKKFDLKSARDNYLKAIKYDSKQVGVDGYNVIDVYNNLGAIQIDLGALGEAEKNLKTCIRMDPAYAAAYKNLGILYDTKMNNAAKAVENYNTYLRLRPNCPERNLVKMWISALRG